MVPNKRSTLETNMGKLMRRAGTWMQRRAAGRPALASLCALATVLAPTASPAQVSPPAASDNTCAVRYHSGLGAGVLAKARATQRIADALRNPAPGLPGHWLFWDGSGVLAVTAHQQRQLSTPQLDLQSNRLCARQVLMRGGRIRCLDWQPIPAGYQPPEPKPPAATDPAKDEITPLERRIASALSSRVSRAGAFAELETGTAFFHIIQRTTDELITYANQPPRTAICSGATAMVGFYRRQLEPLWQKSSAAGTLKREALRAAIANLGAALGHTVTLTEPADLASGARDLLARTRETVATLAPPAAEPPAAEVPLAQPPEPPEPLAQPQGAPPPTPAGTTATPFATLADARALLTSARLEALPPETRNPLLRALRHLEFAAYADLNAARWNDLRAAFDDALGAIIATHETTCTC